MSEPDDLRAALEQIDAVCADNIGSPGNGPVLALHFIRSVINPKLAAPRPSPDKGEEVDRVSFPVFIEDANREIAELRAAVARARAEAFKEAAKIALEQRHGDRETRINIYAAIHARAQGGGNG